MKKHSERISPKLLIIGVSLLLLFSGCKKAPEDKVMPPTKEVSPTTAPVEAPYTIKLSPTSPLRSDQITVELHGISSPEKLRYQWVVNDSEIAKANSPVFQSDSVRRGDRIKVRLSVEGENKTYTSDEVIIKNTPPQIQSAKLIPQNPKKGDELRIEARTFDADNDPVNFSYEWFINEKPSGKTSEAIAINELIKTGDKVSVKITPRDGEAEGIPVTLSSFIANSPPNVSPNIAASFNGLVYTSKVIADDPEGNPLTYTLKAGPKGMTIDSKSGVITWEVKPEDKGEHNIILSVTDGHGGETIVPFTARISFAPPSSGK